MHIIILYLKIIHIISRLNSQFSNDFGENKLKIEMIFMPKHKDRNRLEMRHMEYATTYGSG